MKSTLRRRVVNWLRCAMGRPRRCCADCLMRGELTSLSWRRRCPRCGGTKVTWFLLADVEDAEDDD